MSSESIQQLAAQACAEFREHFGLTPTTAAYAPGRVEVLGNHTDYNEGYVLSAAINRGTVIVAAPSPDGISRIYAPDVREEDAFGRDPLPDRLTHGWANYPYGVYRSLLDLGIRPGPFCAAFRGNIPIGAGLSSSAAFEIATGLVLSRLADREIAPLDLARAGQRAEHQFVGVKCGLLDQISSLYGRNGQLVMTDFRSLDVASLPLGNDLCLLVCNTAVKHSLVESAYNERRRRCEEAAHFCAGHLPHPVKALRDVTPAELEQLRPRMDPVTARRAAHVVGENDRVLRARTCLARGDVTEFGQLMFASHASSMTNFENSCDELDFVVAEAKKLPGVLGARLSGGGFGGSAVLLLHPRDAEAAGAALRTAYARRFGHACTTLVIEPAEGARLLDLNALAGAGHA